MSGPNPGVRETATALASEANRYEQVDGTPRVPNTCAEPRAMSPKKNSSFVSDKENEAQFNNAAGEKGHEFDITKEELRRRRNCPNEPSGPVPYAETLWRVWRNVRGKSMLRTGNHHDAEDVASDIVERFIRYRHTLVFRKDGLPAQTSSASRYSFYDFLTDRVKQVIIDPARVNDLRLMKGDATRAVPTLDRLSGQSRDGGAEPEQQGIADKADLSLFADAWTDILHRLSGEFPEEVRVVSMRWPTATGSTTPWEIVAQQCGCSLRTAKEYQSRLFTVIRKRFPVLREFLLAHSGHMTCVLSQAGL